MLLDLYAWNRKLFLVVKGICVIATTYLVALDNKSQLTFKEQIGGGRMKT